MRTCVRATVLLRASSVTTPPPRYCRTAALRSCGTVARAALQCVAVLLRYGICVHVGLWNGVHASPCAVQTHAHMTKQSAYVRISASTCAKCPHAHMRMIMIMRSVQVPLSAHAHKHAHAHTQDHARALAPLRPCACVLLCVSVRMHKYLRVHLRRYLFVRMRIRALWLMRTCMRRYRHLTITRMHSLVCARNSDCDCD